MLKKRIAVLGSTGSIGRQTLEVAEQFPDRLEVVALAAYNEVDLLTQQAKKHKPLFVTVADESKYEPMKKALAGTGIQVYGGTEGLLNIVTSGEIDTVVTAIVGTAGLLPTMEAIKAGKNIALANKETLVAAGELVMAAARKNNVVITPVDSEHSAIFQSLCGNNVANVANLWLTASGGPFRGFTREQMSRVTAKDALNHPNWSMGAKITIDSATLMNKGLEVIEARWLFEIPYDRIKVVIHPQSIIHSMVEYNDGSFIAQLGLPDMRLPIQYALSYPERWENDFPRAGFYQMKDLTFASPDGHNFPCLELAYDAGKTGGTMPAVMNAANEVAVSSFLAGKVSFNEIHKVIANTMAKHQPMQHPSLHQITDADSWAREVTLKDNR